MNRQHLQKIARLRVQEARILLNARQYAGAHYLIGYAIECALKACVAKQTRRYDFPDKRIANEAFTHDLEKLIRVAGLGLDFANDRTTNRALEINWAVVKDWSEAVRYEYGITEAQAKDLYSASVGRNGVLPWIRKRW
jgi:hypothetical protein